MTSVSEKVLKNIEKHKITPRPKWVFGLQNIAIWSSGIIFLLIVGFAFSVVIYMIKESDWATYGNINNSLLKYIFIILPYFWIIILTGLVFLVNFNLKNTKGGYKFRFRTIVIFVLLVSVTVGAVLYMVGMGRAIDEAFADRVPMYEEFVNKANRDKRMWMNPDHGLLAGVVISVEDDKNFRISDFNNDVWNVQENEDTIVRGFEFGTNRGVKIVGKEFVNPNALSQGERAFEARIIEVMPDIDFIKRHPMMGKRIIEMGADAQGHLPSPSSFMQMEYKEGTLEELSQNRNCSQDKDCVTPFSFLIRSNCPFESHCIKDNCRVTCPMKFNIAESENNKAQCLTNDDCDCSQYNADDALECICLSEKCLVIVN